MAFRDDNEALRARIRVLEQALARSEREKAQLLGVPIASQARLAGYVGRAARRIEVQVDGSDLHTLTQLFAGLGPGELRRNDGSFTYVLANEPLAVDIRPNGSHANVTVLAPPQHRVPRVLFLLPLLLPLVLVAIVSLQPAVALADIGNMAICGGVAGIISLLAAAVGTRSDEGPVEKRANKVLQILVPRLVSAFPVDVDTSDAADADQVSAVKQEEPHELEELNLEEDTKAQLEA